MVYFEALGSTWLWFALDTGRAQARRAPESHPIHRRYGLGGVGGEPGQAGGGEKAVGGGLPGCHIVSAGCSQW